MFLLKFELDILKINNNNRKILEIMKKIKILFATAMLSLAIVGGFQAHEYANMTTGSILLENVEALASGGEDGKFPKYINDTKHSSNSEFETRVDKDGVSVTYKRSCQSAITTCKNTRKDDDICYETLNGAITTCGEWSK